MILEVFSNLCVSMILWLKCLLNIQLHKSNYEIRIIKTKKNKTFKYHLSVTCSKRRIPLKHLVPIPCHNIKMKCFSTDKKIVCSSDLEVKEHYIKKIYCAQEEKVLSEMIKESWKQNKNYWQLKKRDHLNMF